MFDHDFKLTVGLRHEHLSRGAREHEHSEDFKRCIRTVGEKYLGKLTRKWLTPKDLPPFVTEGKLVPAETVRGWLQKYLDETAPKEHGLVISAVDTETCRYTKNGWVSETGFTMTQGGWPWGCNEAVAEYKETHCPELSLLHEWALAFLPMLVIVSWRQDVDIVPA